MASFRGLQIVVAGAVLLTAAPAHAQGFFNSWFGNGQQQQRRNDSWFGGRPQQPVPPQGNAYSDPSNPTDRPVLSPNGEAQAPSAGTGRAVSYCVRTCDGRYFPMQRFANANPVQLCSAFCPAAKTMVFNGSPIEHAVAANGVRYSDLDNAFVYRQKIVQGCTCNGKDSFGLARIDVANDPTLRQGDVVASGDNVKAALLAMSAAKERQLAREVAEKPASRPGAVRRVAGPPTAVPAEAEAEVAPGDQSERPED